MEDMISYIEAAMERAMKVTEAILRAIARKVTWWHEAENHPHQRPADAALAAALRRFVGRRGETASST